MVVFCKLQKWHKFWGTFFHGKSYIYVQCDKKKCLDYILGSFSQTHLVALICTYWVKFSPEVKVEMCHKNISVKTEIQKIGTCPPLLPAGFGAALAAVVGRGAAARHHAQDDRQPHVGGFWKCTNNTFVLFTKNNTKVCHSVETQTKVQIRMYFTKQNILVPVSFLMDSVCSE
jgi:hypothetical protein